ncbi:conserved hypothetical protein [Ricinus communis]|uniref:Uncharacterized protein n=1 Tax=Ricinus communis TaxID=3988 RepID=B9RJK6_RICCO|nr:conserved hypothetical protein [Ricinus communis]
MVGEACIVELGEGLNEISNENNSFYDEGITENDGNGEDYHDTALEGEKEVNGQNLKEEKRKGKEVVNHELEEFRLERAREIRCKKSKQAEVQHDENLDYPEIQVQNEESDTSIDSEKNGNKSEYFTSDDPGSYEEGNESESENKCKEIGHNKRSYKNQGEASHALEPEGTLASLACQSQSVHQVPIAEAQCESGNDNGNKRKNPSHKGSINSEVIIDHGSGNTEHHGDGWSFRYALTERRKLQTRKAATSTDSADLRKIKFAQEGAGPRNLGYTVQSDLQWNENLAITTRQLDETRQQMIGTLSKKAINSGACSSSKFARA